MAETVADTRRLITKPQNLNDAYGPPSNFLEIDVSNPQTVGVGRGRFTTYEIRVKVRLTFAAAPRGDCRAAPSAGRAVDSSEGGGGGRKWGAGAAECARRALEERRMTLGLPERVVALSRTRAGASRRPRETRPHPA